MLIEITETFYIDPNTKLKAWIQYNGGAESSVMVDGTEMYKRYSGSDLGKEQLRKVLLEVVEKLNNKLARGQNPLEELIK